MYILKLNMKIIILTYIGAFILLTWICHFNVDMRYFSKILDNNYYHSSKLDARTYRLLGKYEKLKDSKIVYLKKDVPHNVKYEKKNIRNNEKWTEKKEHNRNLLNMDHYYTQVTDYNNGIFDGKHFHFERKWIKKKDYECFLEKKRRICDISLRKIKLRKYKFGVALFLLFFFLGIGLSVLPGLPFIKTVEGWMKDNELLKSLYSALDDLKNGENFYIYIGLFSIIIIKLSVIVIIVIYKILRNNEKYNRIKLMTE
ncbi:fam-m protein [Plasmodium malariae]|uniref:Fam-m protein n=1 Tax=Plasmodium malariae TaxID=5858 RepID=A0A1D3TDQ6_PLAMA|nr:fam-m protein [Plasmodium malariae]SCP03069.1 fam-m protein [Plasmodium malariae]